jgi:PAS domain-containing protein
MLINAHDGAIIAVNSSALQLFDCGSVNVVGKTTIDLGIWVEPQERSRLMHLMAGVGQFKDQKVRMRTVGGHSLAARCRVPGV